jgi:Carboxypeptidase regulatory-like domain
MRLRTLTCLAVLLALIWALSPQTLRADVTGVILGTVTDPSGAAVPRATVRLVNADTGLVRTASTDSVGSFEFLAVPVGSNYRVEVEAKGFQKTSQSHITLLVNQRFRADFSLVVGSTTQTIEISAHTVQVETTSTQLGDVIDDKKMTGLPLNGRSYIDLLGLKPAWCPSLQTHPRRTVRCQVRSAPGTSP